MNEVLFRTSEPSLSFIYLKVPYHGIYRSIKPCIPLSQFFLNPLPLGNSFNLVVYLREPKGKMTLTLYSSIAQGTPYDDVQEHSHYVVSFFQVKFASHI